MKRVFLTVGLMMSLNAMAQTATKAAPQPAAKPANQAPAKPAPAKAAAPAKIPAKAAPVNTWAPERKWGVEVGVAIDKFSYKISTGEILNLSGTGYSIGGLYSVVVYEKMSVRFQGLYTRFNATKDNNICTNGKCEFKLDYLGARVGLETPFLEGSFPLSGLIAAGYQGKLSGTNNVNSARGDTGALTLGLFSPFALDSQTQIPVGISADVYSYTSDSHLYSYNLTVGYTKSF